LTLKPLYPAFDPIEYLTIAKILSVKKDSASRRSAADRAYYATFLICRDTLEKKKYSTPYKGLEDHAYISSVLKKALGSIGNEENRMRRARNTATYDPHDLYNNEDVRNVEWMITTAEEIIKRVKDLPPNPVKDT
jgi:hypothetical protein